MRRHLQRGAVVVSPPPSGGNSRSVQSALAPLAIAALLAFMAGSALVLWRGMPWALAFMPLTVVLLFSAGSLWTATRLSSTLRGLTRTSERLDQGDDDQPTPHTDRQDALGELARALDHLRVNVATRQQQVGKLAYRDQLTGLPNHLQFRDELQRAIAEAGGRHQTLAVLMLDLDRFKHVNSVLGTDFGDRLLERVARRLHPLVRTGDMVARLGGDAFALLMHNTDLALAEQVALRIATAFETPLAQDDHQIDLSASLGIACWPAHASDADALLNRAEVAMLAAKRRSGDPQVFGRSTGGTQVYDPLLDTASAVNLALLLDLRRGMAQGELRLALQPKVSLSTGAVCGAEALVRWQHPERGLLPPMAFIPFAEQTGFIRQLTLWMFEQAAAEQVALAMLGVRRVSVNLSSRDLLDQALPEKLDTILRRHRALADGFCLEVTERSIMNDPERAEATLNRLAERGFTLSIDDFGTGYSSFAQLKRLPVNELKIDKSFVMAMAHDAGDARVVRSTIDLAHTLGLTVVAEGVEDEAALCLLQSLGCDEGQGFHMSPALPVAEFQDWVARWQAQTPVPVSTPADQRTGAPLLH